MLAARPQAASLRHYQPLPARQRLLPPAKYGQALAKQSKRSPEPEVGLGKQAKPKSGVARACRNAGELPMHGAINEKQVTASASRREFFRSGVRYAVLGALTVGAVALGRRSVTRLPNQTCVNQGLCGGCSAYAGCGLPQALSRKQATMGGST
jgi:hypothetical protein